MLTATTIARISIEINETFRASTPLQGKRVEAHEARYLAIKAMSMRYSHVIQIVSPTRRVVDVKVAAVSWNAVTGAGLVENFLPWVESVDGEYTCCNT